MLQEIEKKIKEAIENKKQLFKKSLATTILNPTI